MLGIRSTENFPKRCYWKWYWSQIQVHRLNRKYGHISSSVTMDRQTNDFFYLRTKIKYRSHESFRPFSQTDNNKPNWILIHWRKPFRVNYNFRTFERFKSFEVLLLDHTAFLNFNFNILEHAKKLNLLDVSYNNCAKLNVSLKSNGMKTLDLRGNESNGILKNCICQNTNCWEFPRIVFHVKHFIDWKINGQDCNSLTTIRDRKINQFVVIMEDAFFSIISILTSNFHNSFCILYSYQALLFCLKANKETKKFSHFKNY